MNPDNPALGIDIGGTTIRAGLVSAEGRILCSASAPTPADGSPDELRSAVRQLAAQVRGGEPIAAAGVALPGIWDRATGVMRRAVNLPRLEGVDIAALLEDALQTRPLIESDVNAAGWAQWKRREGEPTSRFLYLSLGTGVGGCVILDGQIVRHTNGGAGHFGFLIVDPSPAAPLGRDGVRGSLASCIAAADLDTSPGLAAAADALAVAIWQIAHIYLPGVILLGGGVIDGWLQLVDATGVAFAQRCGGRAAGLIAPDPFIERASLKSNEAGVIGAALMAQTPTAL